MGSRKLEAVKILAHHHMMQDSEWSLTPELCQCSPTSLQAWQQWQWHGVWGENQVCSSPGDNCVSCPEKMLLKRRASVQPASLISPSALLLLMARGLGTWGPGLQFQLNPVTYYLWREPQLTANCYRAHFSHQCRAGWLTGWNRQPSTENSLISLHWLFKLLLKPRSFPDSELDCTHIP